MVAVQEMGLIPPKECTIYIRELTSHRMGVIQYLQKKVRQIIKLN